MRQRATTEFALALLRPTIPEHEIVRHRHNDMHIVVLLAGRYVSEAAWMPPVCGEPAVILNPPGTEHRDRFRSRDGRFLTLAMPQAAYARFSDGLRTSDRAVRLPPESFVASLRVLHELAHWDDTSPLAVEAIFARLIADAHCAQSAPAAVPRLARVLERLDDESTRSPTLQELAALAGCHAVHLARIFRRRTGVSPSGYLRRRRVHRAASLICARRTLAEAAAVLGFVDECHLHRCFVSELGMTPGAFRDLALSRAEVAGIQGRGCRRC